MNDGSPTSQVLTVAEVADYLRVSETTVWRWCSTGKLPAFRIGRGWRVRREDLDQRISEVVSDIKLLPADPQSLTHVDSIQGAQST